MKSAENVDGAGARLSRTEYEYDNNAVVNGTGNPNLVNAPGVIMHKDTSDPFTSNTHPEPRNERGQACDIAIFRPLVSYHDDGEEIAS